MKVKTELAHLVIDDIVIMKAYSAIFKAKILDVTERTIYYLNIDNDNKCRITKDNDAYEVLEFICNSKIDTLKSLMGK